VAQSASCFAAPIVTDLPDFDDVADRPRSRDEYFDEVFVRHYGRLVRSVTVVTGDQARAEDAVQEAFQRAFARWRRIGRYDKPEAWIRRVALNRARDLARSERRRKRREERAAGPDAVTDPEPHPEIVPALAQLPDRQRTAIVLHYLEGLSVSDTADAMGITDGAVKFHLNRGRQALAPLLGEDTT
jgi:RNA polymerase sigma-70 factor (ECF subfamily)